MPKGVRLGGRQKGTPNRKTTEIGALLDSMGCNPIEGMAKIANNPKTTPELRGKMYGELAQYVYPKRKAVEHTGPDGGPVGGRLEVVFVSAAKAIEPPDES